MKRLTTFALCGILIACLKTVTFAEEEKQVSKTTLSGFGYIMFGEIMNGVIGDGIPMPGTQSSYLIDHLWTSRAEGDLFLTSRPTDWFTAKLAFVMKMKIPLQYSSMSRESYYASYESSIPVAEGIFHWTFKDHFIPISSLMIESGLFQYTFNPEVKNLGNYAYRSRAYPIFTLTKVDYPWADLMGMRTQVGFFNDKIKLETILNSVFNFPPWYDWSLGFNGSYTPNKIIDVGVGILFDRQFVVRHENLPPDSQEIFQGTTTEARFTFDPKPLLKPLFGDLFLFDDKSFVGFGPEDFKIYGEAAVLGQKDTIEYDYLPKPIYWLGMPLHRMPLLLGINVPTFKLLDVFSVELEWFKSPYPNHWFGMFTSNSAKPNDVGNDWERDNYINKDNLKWSVYLKKKIANFEIRALFANDHSIYRSFSLESRTCYEQTMKRPGDWHWNCELRYNF